MSISKTINLNTLAQGVGKVIAVIFGFITTLVLRRFFGQDGFGDYIFTITFVAIFVSLSDFGTHLVSVAKVAQADKIQEKVLGNALILRFFLSFLSIFLAYLLGFVFLRDKKIYSFILLALPLIIILGFKNSLIVIFHSRLKLYFAACQEILVSLFLLLAALLLVWRKGNLGNYLLLISLSQLLTLIPFTFLAGKLTLSRFKIDFNILKGLFSHSLPLGLILVAFTLYSRLDTLILQFVWGAGSVGVYGLSFKVYENLILPAAFLMNSSLPVMAKRVKRKERVNPLLQKSADLLTAGALTLVLLIFLSAPLIIKILTGIWSGEEVFVLRVLLLALPFAFLNHLTGYTIIALDQQKKSLIISLIALSFNLVANLIFIPIFSFKAAAVNALATQAIVLLLSLRILRQELDFRLNWLSWPGSAWEFIVKKGRVFEE